MLSLLLFLLTASGFPVAVEPERWPYPEDSSPGYIRLNAYKYEGETWNEALPWSDESRPLIKRDGNTVEVPLVNSKIYYGTTIELGSDRQKVSVLLDTGSSDLWVVGNHNPQCEKGSSGGLSSAVSADTGTFVQTIQYTEGLDGATESDPFTALDATATEDKAASTADPQPSVDPGSIDCSGHGTFNSKTSDTFKSNHTDFHISYADSTFASGTWARDTLRIGGVDVPNLSFAVSNMTNNTMGVFGIGFPGMELSGTYENFPQKLKNRGLIHTAAYSVYLNDSRSGQASILFGAIDHEKYKGVLSLFQIMLQEGYTDYNQIQIELDGITLGSTDNGNQTQIGSGISSALLDTGTTNLVLPSDMLSRIIDEMDFHYDEVNGANVTRCESARGMFLTFTFQQVDFRVPLSNFLRPLVTTRGKSTGYCICTIQESNSGIILGDSFLRQVYFVVDLDHHRVALAQANPQSQKENIEIIRGAIPGASAHSQSTGSESQSLHPVTSSYVPVSPSTPLHVQTPASAISTAGGTTGTSSPSSGNRKQNSANGSFGLTRVCVLLAGLSLVVMI